jgi:hypothetical protein
MVVDLTTRELRDSRTVVCNLQELNRTFEDQKFCESVLKVVRQCLTGSGVEGFAQLKDPCYSWPRPTCSRLVSRYSRSITLIRPKRRFMMQSLEL